ncbi:uroporphyrinogen decarboxylase [uncultured Campylobacter sp.]|uniref:uroporphyrinogen decarboxylase n=1 Tax=uncultured Campylobacter sp. TaxID=218934 RepID=UPI0026315E1D|nr:uroporphyrinogen decarboxylase [uncultured Campylobacter sp.]
MVFIDACFGKETPYTPIWMMRQAGRYLPQYMAVRERAGDFLSLCRDYRAASEVTIQPVEILGVDAAILFSDILVVPMQMGMDLRFEAGEGPKFSDPIRSRGDLARLDPQKAAAELGYVYDTISLTRSRLAADKALIGFCGAPWTIATYMIEGGSSKNYAVCKRMLYENPQLLHEILRLVTEATKLYLARQIGSGVDAVQIFDSWAGALEPSAYEEFGWRYILEITEFLKAKFSHIPLIVFAKGTGAQMSRLSRIAEQRGAASFDVWGVDWSTPIELAREQLGGKFALQGNLEPMRLYDRSAIESGVREILAAMKGVAHIFNLGHGILPDVSVQNAKYLVDLVHELTAR